MITAGFSILKSLGKPKRKRDGDESDSPGDPDTDSASKRARARASGGNGAAATKSKGAAASPSFITSSVRKTKTKGKTSKSEVSGNGGDDRVERDLRARFQSVDEGEEAREKRVPRSKSEKSKTGPAGRAKKSAAGAGGSGGMMGIFSPVFAYFGGAGPATRARRAAAGATGKETKTNQPRKSSSARASSSRGAAGATGAAAAGKAAPAKRKDSARDSASARRTRSLATSDDDDARDDDDEGSSDDDVPVARLVSPSREARPPSRAAPRGGHAALSAAESLESDEAEETESDDAVLAASRGVGAGTSAERGAYAAKASKKGSGSAEQNPNLAPDGTIIQNGFGKADTTLEDEYEYEDEMDESNYDEEYDPWIFIGGLPPLRSCVPKNRPRLLPPKTPVHVNKNTLVLDLDETLVHSDLEQTAGKAADFSFPVHFNNQKHVVNVKKRPFLAEFMEFAARHFEVVVFTASQRVYAERLLDTLDPDAVLVKHRLYREACVLVDGNYMKDLSAIGRDLRNVVIVDNSPQAFGFQTENGVPIESWFDDPNDAQLLKLMPLLARLAASEDVRPVLRKKFNLDARVRAAEEKAEARARAEGRQL
jgi:CTD small phosphatase-like protein 2